MVVQIVASNACSPSFFCGKLSGRCVAGCCPEYYHTQLLAAVGRTDFSWVHITHVHGDLLACPGRQDAADVAHMGGGILQAVSCGAPFFMYIQCALVGKEGVMHSTFASLFALQRALQAFSTRGKYVVPPRAKVLS